MQEASLSVIIPVKNGANTLTRCLSSIQNQLFVRPIEILVLDSGSTDGSVQIAKSFGAKVIAIDPDSFNHGLTRNIGVYYAQGDLLFFTVQDASLSDTNVLENMARWFDDEKVMGVCGHQAVPHEKDKNPILWFKRYSDPIAEIRKYESDKSMPAYSWDNVISMYRKIALEKLPFEKTDIAEDWIWAFNALLKGWKLIYDPSLVIYHYHHRSFTYVFKVEYSLYYTFYKNFKIVPNCPGYIIKNIKAIYHISQNNLLTFNDKLNWTFHNLLANSSHALAYLLFRTAFFIAKDQAVDWLYLKICNKIPQGRQNSKF